MRIYVTTFLLVSAFILPVGESVAQQQTIQDVQDTNLGNIDLQNRLAQPNVDPNQQNNSRRSPRQGRVNERLGSRTANRVNADTGAQDTSSPAGGFQSGGGEFRVTNGDNVSGSAPGAVGVSGGSSGGLRSIGEGVNRNRRFNPRDKREEPKFQSTAAMYLYSERERVDVNDSFDVEVRLVNPKRLDFNSVAIALKYDPDFLQPVQDTVEITGKPEQSQATSRFQSANTASVSDDYLLSSVEHSIQQNEIDTVEGRINLSARMEMNNTGKTTVARIRFMALKETPDTAVEFVFEPVEGLLDLEPVGQEPLVQVPVGETPVNVPASLPSNLPSNLPVQPTHLMKNREDVLGTPTNPMDGAIPFSISIDETQEENKKLIVDGEEEEDKPEKVYETDLRLSALQSSVDVGETFDVDVLLSNPQKEDIDKICLLILFNPDYLEAVDMDPRGTGVNLQVKTFDNPFQFDVSISNEVDQQRGVIAYQARTLRNKVHGEGVVATMRFRALKPTTRTTFRIVSNSKGEAPTTGVFYKGTDILGNPNDPFDGFSTTSISIRPTMAYVNRIMSVR